MLALSFATVVGRLHLVPFIIFSSHSLVFLLQLIMALGEGGDEGADSTKNVVQSNGGEAQQARAVESKAQAHGKERGRTGRVRKN